MEPLTLINFIKETILFFLVLIFYFYLPGRFLLAKLKLTDHSPIPGVLPTIIGVILCTIFAYIASWIDALPLTLVPIILITIYSLRHPEHRRGISLINPKEHHVPLLVISILAILFSLPRTLGGIWGNTFTPVMDDTLHLAYINELFHHFPPDHPGFAGTALKGYHFFLDFLTATISKLSTIPITSLHFHYLPLLVSFGFAYSVYCLMFLWTKRRDAGLWAVFLALFGGSFGYILRLQGHTNISLATVFGMDQPTSAILNTPYAFSLMLISAALLVIYMYTQEKKAGWLILAALLVGVGPIFKVYAGIILFTGFACLIGIEILKKNVRATLAFLFAVSIALLTYGVFAGSGNYLIFLPLWAPHRMLEFNLPWYGFHEKYETYTRLGVIRGLVELETFGLLLFIFGNLGTRLIGVLVHTGAWLKKKSAPSAFALILISMAAASMLLPLFFIQSVKVFEMIQLTFYFPFFAALAAAWGLAKISDLRIPKFFRAIIITVIIICTLPSAFETFSKYVFAPKPRTIISNQKDYQYLATHGSYDETILELPSESLENSAQALTLWHQGTSARFAAFANKRSFYNSTEIDFPNLDIQGRATFLMDIRKLLHSGKTNKDQFANLQILVKKLKSSGVVYIYSPYQLELLEIFAMEPVFMNNSTFIYKLK